MTIGNPTPSSTRRWALDGLGNWQSLETTDSSGATSESRLSTTFNEYSKVDGAIQEHDTNGNLTFDGSQHYQWDAFNRLRVALDSSLNTLGTYTYDAGNRRMRKVATIDAATNTTDFYYINWQVLEEREIAGDNKPTTPYRQFVYGNYIDEPIIMDVNENPGTDSYTTGTADSRYFYHQDTLYSVYALTDEDQNIVEAYEYDPYGKHVLLTDGDSDGYVEFNGSDARTEQGVSGLGNRVGFTGRCFDAETGNMDFRRRVYSVDLGRFATHDPSGFIDGESLRAAYFVPNATDPSGKCISGVPIDWTTNPPTFINPIPSTPRTKKTCCEMDEVRNCKLLDSFITAGSLTPTDLDRARTIAGFQDLAKAAKGPGSAGAILGTTEFPNEYTVYIQYIDLLLQQRHGVRLWTKVQWEVCEETGFWPFKSRKFKKKWTYHACKRGDEFISLNNDHWDGLFSSGERAVKSLEDCRYDAEVEICDDQDFANTN